MDPIYRSPLNRDVPLAAPGEFRPMAIGPISVWPPVVLAPMAGVTNPPFRTLCRLFGAGLYVSEMITARALVEGNRKTLLLASFGPEEAVRSLQLYGVDPYHVGEAVRVLVGEGRVDHIDMNFGCPVRKVTSKGGGAAIPLKPRLLAGIVRAAVAAAGTVPVTIKFRMGIDDRYQTFLEAGRIGQEEGCAAVGLHARTAAQLYDGEARWDAIARLKQAVTRIPVLGNGDIWEAEDALRMMRTTGCDGVIVGRGCLGRPWLFRDLADVFEGREPRNPPSLGGVVDVMLEHARLLMDWVGGYPSQASPGAFGGYGGGFFSASGRLPRTTWNAATGRYPDTLLGEEAAMRAFRKHSTWYTKGFRGGAALRERLMHVTSLAELTAALATVDGAQPFPPEAMRVPRGKTAGTQQVALPEGYLDDLEDATPPGPLAEAADSGG